MTECECPLAGYCNKHKCEKTEHLHKLCQTRQDYFDLWESGKGPGQNVTIEITEEDVENQKPNLVDMAYNFAGAIKKYIKSNVKFVDEEVYKERLETCEKCIFQKNGRCLHKKCGCVLTAKAKLASETCPDGRWNA